MKTRILFLGLLITLLFNGKVNGQIVPNGNFNNGITNWSVSGNNVSIATGADTGGGATNGSNISIINSTSISEQFNLSSTQFSLLQNEIYNLSISYGHYTSGIGGGLGIEFTTISQISSLNLKDLHGNVIQTISLTNCTLSGNLSNPPLLNNCGSNNFTVTNSGIYSIEIISSVGKSNGFWNIPNEFFVFDKINLSKRNEDHSILGKVSYDSSNTCNSSSGLLQNIQLKTTGTNGTYFTSSNSSGNYAFAFDENGSVTTEIVTQGLSSLPITNTFTSGTAQTETNQDFCVSSSSTGDDVSVLIIPTSDARPGFNSRYRIEYKNTGSTTVSGDVLLNFEDFRMHSPVSIPSANSTSINSLTWNYSGLTPFETRVINVEFINNTPTQTSNPLVGGESFNFTANITPLNSDINQSDNDFNLSHLVVNSYDPNDATILEGSQITAAQATQDLHFRIRFQNTGTASAIDINVKTMLDADLDLATFTPISASHAYSTSVNTTTGVVNFNFPNINLADSTVDEPNSHGWVLYKVKPKSSFAVGDVIDCGADIFFDYNAPIVTNVAQTQIYIPATTAIPDAAFEQALIDLGHDNVIDGQVLTANISGVATLYLSYLGIEKLDGIEDFKALEDFTFQDNDQDLTKIDLTSNLNLKKITIYAPLSLTTFNISGLAAVTSLVFVGSGVTSMDVSTLISLTEFQVVQHSLITSININNGFNNNISTLSINSTPLLSCVVSDAGTPAIGLAGWNNPQNIIFDTTCSQALTYVPDDNFEAYLEANSLGNGILNDDKVTTANINIITALDVSSQSISDLTGIKDFAALVDLNASSNIIATINVTKNTVLEKLILNDNSLTSIDVSKNTALKQLWVRQNNLTILDVSKNTSLEWLIASINSIQNLDLSLNTNLIFIEIHTNNLQTLNLKNRSTTSLSFDAQLNRDLTCIEVDNPSLWTTNFSSQIDTTASFNTDCSYPITNIPDAVFENYLETHDRNGNVVALGDPSSMGNGVTDTEVFTHRINTVTQLDVSNVGLSFLTGLEGFRDLENFGAFGGNNGLISADFSTNLKLKRITFTFNSNATSVTFGNLPDVEYIQLGYCNIDNIDLSGLPNLKEFKEFSSKLTTLNVSSNPKLETLTVQGGILTALDVSANPDLKNVSVTGNQITGIDISNNPKIETFNVSNNQLTSLNLNNGFNTLINSQAFNITNNPALTCITVDDVFYAATNWTAKDSQHFYSLNCGKTYIADTNLENYLETHDKDGNLVAILDPTNMGDGIAGNNYVYTNRINTVIVLRVNGLTISDMTGIEDFAALQVLDAHDNSISSIDVSGLASLYHLSLGLNPLNTINVSSNSNLRILEVNSTNLINLDVTSNSVLEFLKIDDTSLTSIDTSLNPNLKTLSTENTPLTQVDLTNNTLLQFLELRDNALIGLDISNNLQLISFVLTGSPVTSLDLSQHDKLIEVRINNNASLAQLNIKNGTNTNIPTTSFDITNNPGLTCIEVDDVNYSNTNWTTKDTQHLYNTSCVPANSTYVPDDNFEAYLETHDKDGNIVSLGDVTGMGNGIANDDYVFTNRIDSVIELVVNNMSIYDMTGIEDFSALKILRCTINTISNLDVTKNLNLEKLVCGNNPLGSLDVSQNVNLKTLWCQSNQLTILDVSNNLMLEDLVFSGNSIATINVTHNTALTKLNAHSNQLTTLDVSQNINLINLNIHSNQFTTIDIRQNVALQTVEISGNQLTLLDVSQNTSLTRLSAFSNQLRTLDVSQNVNLNYLACSSNLLTSLIIKNGVNNLILTADFWANNNPSLTCIEVSDLTYATANWTNKDVGASYSTDCSSIWTVMTNPTTTTALLAITGLDADNDGNITLAETAAFTGALDLSGLSLTDVAGLQAFINVTVIDLRNNNITDFSPLTDASIPTIQKSTGATKVQARTGAFNLEELLISNNNAVQSLDVSKLTKLKKLVIKDNPNLITVSVKNANNAAITDFDSSNTPNLSCILVDNPNATYLTTWTKDIKNNFVADEAQCRAEVLSIDNFDVTNNVSLYPNPVKDYLKIELRNQLEIQNIQIYNVIGKLVNETESLEVGFTKLSKGIYLLKIITDKGIATKKVIKN
jgi:Leucine-rich repeat (LRR) protein